MSPHITGHNNAFARVGDEVPAVGVEELGGRPGHVEPATVNRYRWGDSTGIVRMPQRTNYDRDRGYHRGHSSVFVTSIKVALQATR